MRRSSILPAVSLSLAVLLTVAGSATAAFGEGSGSAARSGAIPPGFHAQSVSWISPEHGWMLGSAPCGQDTCTTVVGTTDGGATWNPLGTMDAPLTIEQKNGVTEVRFADDQHGWAFDPSLWSTTDGGVTWRRGTTPGDRPVVALAGDANAAYAVVSGCRFGEPLFHCTHQATLWRATSDQGSWTKVPLTLPVASQAILAVHGLVAYLVVPAGELLPDVLEVTVDGQRWSSRPDPCDPSQAEYLSGVAPVSDTKVALLCEAAIGFGQAEKRVRRSDDTAQTTSGAGMLPVLGISSQLAAAPNGILEVATYSIGSWIYRNAGGQTWTTPVDLGDGGMGWNDLVFTTNQVGFVVHGPVSCCGGHGAGELWKTEDGGLTWGPV